MSNTDIAFLTELEAIIRQRTVTDDSDSYTAELVRAGRQRIAQKVGEEAVELVIASVAGSRQAQCEEAADLVYHLLVMLQQNELSLGDVTEVLRMRHAATQ